MVGHHLLVMGMYLSKTYLEVKKRPIDIVRETETDEEPATKEEN